MTFWQHPLIKNIGPDQFGSLFKTTPASVLGVLINSSIMSFALLQDVNWHEVALWWGINFMLAAYALWRWYKNKDRSQKINDGSTPKSKRSIRKLMLTTLVFSLPWAYLMANYLGELSHNSELVLVAVVGGMTASGSLQLSRIYPAALTYLSVLTITGIAKCFYLNTQHYYLLGLLILSYGFFLRYLIARLAKLSIDRTQAIKSLKSQVHEMDRTKADLQRFAMEDPLTCLPNRREFHERLTTAINEAKRQGSTVALLVCDLDHFKNINDISGHSAGDIMLTEIANRLQHTIRDYDVVARIGGDEFAIIAKHHKSPKNTAEFANRLLSAIGAPLNIDGKNVVPGMSIGISMFPYDAQDDKTILAHANLALQRGKATSRGQFNFFDHKMKSDLSSDEAMENDLRLALVENEFELFYQPKISIRTGQLQGFEALLRWRQADGKLVAPGAFFPVAESRGLMSYIADFVIEQAIKDIRNWREQGYDPGKISINIHPVQIKDKHRMKRLVRDIERSGINPGDIYLEITEDCVIGRGTENTPEMLKYLRNKGFRISLDDFGTGYASLSHLKDLPVDELKFDRSFISDLLINATNRAIVHAMVKLATSLGITTVAEGIETQEQHNMLMAIGCTTGQGYLYNKPLEMNTATQLIQAAQNNMPERIMLKKPPVSPQIVQQPDPAAKSA